MLVRDSESGLSMNSFMRRFGCRAARMSTNEPAIGVHGFGSLSIAYRLASAELCCSFLLDQAREDAARPWRKFQIVGRVGMAAIAVSCVIPLRQAHANDKITELNNQIIAVAKNLDLISGNPYESDNFIQLTTLNLELGGLSAQKRWTVNQINAGTLVDPRTAIIVSLPTRFRSTTGFRSSWDKASSTRAARMLSNGRWRQARSISAC
jgi:hypothetical protein